ncbi:uncharacterized protein LOC111367051 isoform X3 [Olea europaea var. sylvestris]|uniref:uncharacterized protein LOC111367051 isoform X3 n=1 Tax=Olea europaea var. sylvestris TaxID=158386 RepID=UPI000C1D6069|nr:uncharacterized protein LOC111367051 isoform X3 [Olea europaea var. sylvestris]
MRMHILVREISVPLIHKQISEARARLKQPETIRRRRALRRVDKELEKGNYKSALSLVKQLQGKPGGLRGFGAAQQVPRRISSLDELKLGGEVEISSLELIVDSVLRSIKCSLEFALWEDDEEEVSLLGFRNLMNGEIKDSPCEDHLMCMQVYIETMSKKIFTKGKLSNETLKKFLRVILGGLVAEHFMFGYSELLHSDVEKLERVLKWLGFTEIEADSLIRQATVDTVLILSRQKESWSSLAEAMALGRSVGLCIDTIERTLNF